MSIVEKIKKPIQEEMQLFEQKFKEAMQSNAPLLNRITYYIVRRKGKQMRPMFVFLIAKMLSKDNTVTEKTYRGASIIELIHTATLVHDDVVDESYKRRGFFSINALWKNKIAVLVGDFLLSKGLLLSIDYDHFDILKHISVAVRDMSEGELLQIEKARRLNITEAIYFDIIRQKTASLIAACCAIGAASVDSLEEDIENARKFGEYVGIAFQLKDDLFDYTDSKIGKPTGIDIRERKLTLPLIYTLNNASKKEVKWAISIVKNHHKRKRSIKELIEFVTEKGGITYTNQMMEEYQKKAVAILQKFPDSEYKESLKILVDYVIERKI